MTPIPASRARLRLLLVNSNTNAEMTAKLAAQAAAGHGDAVEVTAVTPPFGAPYVETRADVTIAAYAILVAIARAVRAAPQRFDACVIACFGEPGLAAARELFDFPVVGPAEAAMHTAAQVSTRFALLSRGDGWTPMLRELVTLYGFERQCAGIYSLEALRNQGHQAPADLAEAACHYVRHIARQTGADAVILGGAALTGVAPGIQPQLPIRVIDALSAGVGQACHLASLGLGRPRAELASRLRAIWMARYRCRSGAILEMKSWESRVTIDNSAAVLQQEVERLRPDIVECLRGLVRIPSITGDEAAIAAHIAGLLREMKFSVEVLEAEPGRPNLIATWDSGRPGKTLLLNDHLDMVPPGPLENWTHPPYAAEIADGCVYGRGTIDTKSGVTTMLMATRALVNSQLPINGKLILAFSCDEEVAGDLGIKYLQKLGRLKADLALVTEPTTMKLELGTKGRLDLIFETQGVATHGARPWLGHNAIEDMMLVIAGLQKYAASLASRTHPRLGRASLNVGKIEGGTVGNMVPSHCRIEVDRRVLPNEDVDGVMAEIQAVLDALSREHSRLQVTMKKRIFWSGYVVEEESPVVQTFCRAFAAVVGTKPELGYKDAGTDAPYIFLSGTPVVMFSPGNGHRAMNADENVDIADLVLATKVIAQFIHDVLVLRGEG